MKPNLPEDWTPGYGGLSADTGLADNVFTKKGNQSLMVRYDYRVGGFRAFKYLKDPNPHRIVGTSNEMWVAHTDCPVFDDPLTCMIWLNVESA